MFDFFSWQHLTIMLVVALVVVGPKDLPRLMNMAGKWAGKARTMATEFRRSFDEMARESELAELRKEIDDLKKNNPISDLANSMASVESEVASSMEAVAPSVPAEAATAKAVEPRSGEFAVTDSAPRNAPIVETP
ncbi:MAG: Sec-independent protein translocase protein TatB [Rhizomicrobium sp.]